MPPFTYTFVVDGHRAALKMDAPIGDDFGSYRTGRIILDSGRTMAIVCRHSDAAAALTYLHEIQVNDDWKRLIGLSDFAGTHPLDVPGQLVLGAQRAQLLAQGMRDIVHAPDLNGALKRVVPEKIALMPIAREGTQCHLAKSLHATCGYACEEIAVTVRASEKPGRLHVAFQDQAFTEAHRERMHLALIGGSVLNGRTHIALMQVLQQRFKTLARVELLAPQAGLQGLARLLAIASPGLAFRAHTFETLLDGDTHFPHPEFHITPDLETRYRAWWGRDPMGFSIASMPCAGIDRDIPLFDPVRQIRTLNKQLAERHRVTLAAVFARNLAQARASYQPRSFSTDFK